LDQKEEQMRNGVGRFAVALFAGCLALEVWAHGPGNDLGKLVERANLVVVGQVKRIEYRALPSADTGEGLIPHTFVTYGIEKVVRGSAPGPEITLRIIGGPDGRGRFLAVSRVPVVQQGDRDLLFIENPADPSCPFVECDKGRFRILRDRVYDSQGAPVQGIAHGKIVSRGRPPQEFLTYRFPAPTFDDLLQNPQFAEQIRAMQLSVAEARKRYAAEAPKEIVITDHVVDNPRPDEDRGGNMRPSPQANRETPPLPLAQLLDATESLARTATRKPVAVQSADTRLPVAARRLGALPPASTPVNPKP
jgi:hypothetical protein